MLDHCSIFHKGGIVLWSRSFTPAAASLGTSAASPVNSLVREALIEGRNTDNSYEKDGYSIKWTFVNDLELIFVVAYQRILQLTYAEDLLAAIKSVFLTLYEPFLSSFVASLHGTSISLNLNINEKSLIGPDGSWDFSSVLSGWDRAFDKLLKSIEDKVAQDRKSRLRGAGVNLQSKAALPSSEPASADESGTTPSMDVESGHDPNEIARNVEALKNRLKNTPGSPSRGGRRRPARSRTAKDSPSATDSDTPQPSKKPKPKKVMRTWDGSVAMDSDDAASLDYSTPMGAETMTSSVDLSQLVDESSRGVRGKDGLYDLKDLDMGAAAGEDVAPSTSRFGSLSSLFSKVTGGSRTLTKEDLEPVLAGMQEHLMQKNVAQEIAVKVCEGIGEALVGKRVSGYRGVKNAVREAVSDSITRILTPKTSTDLLLSIRQKLNISSSGATSSVAASTKRTPYIMTFVGVNGVGKSTNLSKVCFWLLQNDFRVLIAACDTFRSGAVEQLRVHVRNLGMLTVGDRKGNESIELYEKGYGKDAAGIAKEAIAYAKDNAFDVVLIDTAGRMQDNEPLMRALAKLVSTNNPDKVIFVGEALVGNEAVDQLSKFDSALKNFSAASGVAAGRGRGIDGMLVTKWDTVDDKVGAALSMTYVTGQPILFVGCGQTYTDLRQLRVKNVVDSLLSD
ncbi:P-loop containing nucleoside triphosphate hydrolase protein [Clavulina sp. PMI_390]|nr:P-loop containing nucleoside triphosphate hydrolase protein [Clavulina sp. PMI_390]